MLASRIRLSFTRVLPWTFNKSPTANGIKVFDVGVYTYTRSRVGNSGFLSEILQSNITKMEGHLNEACQEPVDSIHTCQSLLIGMTTGWLYGPRSAANFLGNSQIVNKFWEMLGSFTTFFASNTRAWQDCLSLLRVIELPREVLGLGKYPQKWSIRMCESARKQPLIQNLPIMQIAPPIQRTQTAWSRACIWA